MRVQLAQRTLEQLCNVLGAAARPLGVEGFCGLPKIGASIKPLSQSHPEQVLVATQLVCQGAITKAPEPHQVIRTLSMMFPPHAGRRMVEQGDRTRDLNPEPSD